MGMKWLPKRRPKRNTKAPAPRRDSAYVLTLRDEAMTRRWERLYAMKDRDFEDRVRDVVIDTLISVGLAEDSGEGVEPLPVGMLPGAEPPRSLN
jgi:hypothetical protein